MKNKHLTYEDRLQIESSLKDRFPSFGVGKLKKVYFLLKIGFSFNFVCDILSVDI